MRVKQVGTRPSHAHGQSGQVLALGLLFSVLLSLVLVRFFYVGEVNHASVRQRHALDAATYSGAIMQSQALNYTAYLNRAYTGHQIAMAHLITMASWAHFSGTEAMRVQQRNPPASLIAMMFGPQHGIAYEAANMAQGMQRHAQFSGALGQAFKTHDAFTLGLLQPASQAIYTQLPRWREQVIRQVLQDNYPEFDFTKNNDQVELVIHEGNWSEQVSWQSASSLSPWLHELLNHYAFLSERNHTARNVWVVDARCPHKRHELRRRGQTRLDDQGLWRSEDTQSFHALRANRWIGCYHREYAMGWAWIPTQSKQTPTGDFIDDAPMDFSQQDFWRWVQEKTNWNIFSGTTNPLASSWAKKDQQQWRGSGLGRYLNTVQPNTVIGFNTTLRLAGPQGQILHSSSEAESYFVRPIERTDRKTESNNLFHPFWQARLQNTSWHQRLQQLVGD